MPVTRQLAKHLNIFIEHLRRNMMKYSVKTPLYQQSTDYCFTCSLCLSGPKRMGWKSDLARKAAKFSWSSKEWFLPR